MRKPNHAPLTSESSMAQPTHANWSSLPAALAERIMRQALQNSGGAVLQWLRLSLVCR